MSPKKQTRNTRGAFLDPWKAALLHLNDLALAPGVSETIRGFIRSRALEPLSDLANVILKEYRIIDDVTFCHLRQIAALFKKNSQFSVKEDCIKNARVKFHRAEMFCRITNKRLAHFYEHEDRMDPMLFKWVNRLQDFLEVLLGDPSECVEDFASTIHLTSGATEDRARWRSLPFLKISGKIRAPRRAFSYLKTALLNWGVEPESCRFADVDTNCITFVPKTWKIHRTIAKEPTHSLPFQLAIDAFIKRRLKRVWGIDLSSQERNQEMARIGSIDGSIATIDLEMASDTLSSECVALAMSPDWFRLLTSFRSLRYVDEGATGTYAKFSSMGNGYTFALETAIFAAACRAVGAPLGAFSVYGDDIAIHQEFVESLIRLLKYLGFKVNSEKSYVDPETRFRESCGCDWLNGVLVTPVYWRNAIGTMADHIHMINFLLSVANPGGELWEYLVASASDKSVPKVPWNGDSRSGIWIAPVDAYRAKIITFDHNGSPVFKGLVPTTQRRRAKGWRSEFLWFLEKRSRRSVRFYRTPSRLSDFLLQDQLLLDRKSRLQTRIEDAVGFSETVIVSEVAVRTVYRRGRRQYVPVHLMVPSHLYLLREALGLRSER